MAADAALRPETLIQLRALLTARWKWEPAVRAFVVRSGTGERLAAERYESRAAGIVTGLQIAARIALEEDGQAQIGDLLDRIRGARDAG